MRRIEIHYRKKADKFLVKNRDKLTKEEVDGFVIKAIKKIYGDEDVNIDLKRMETMAHHFRIRKGNIRIVFSINDMDEVIVSIVDTIGYRGDIYKH